MKKIFAVLLCLISLNLVADGPIQTSAIFPNYIGYIEFSDCSSQSLFDVANELLKEDAEEVDMKIDSKNKLITVVFNEPIDDVSSARMYWNFTFSQNRINYVISLNIFQNGEEISTTYSKDDSYRNEVDKTITEILNGLYEEIMHGLSFHMYEDVVWNLDYWQFNSSDSPHRSSVNERIIFKNGTMTWDGQEYGKSETATYTISGNRINLSNGKWFEVQSYTGSELVLIGSDNIIRTFKNK